MPVPVGDCRWRRGFWSEVGCVVVHDLIVEYANIVAAWRRKVRKIENAYAASVVGHDVVIDVGVFSIFDFEAVHVEFSAIAAENYIFGLADVSLHQPRRGVESSTSRFLQSTG